MAIRSITQLKKWFRRGMYPTESQFADWIDSFWHKEEDRIPMSTIEGLPEVINNKYPITAGKELEREVDTLTADLAAHKVESEYKFNRINENIEELDTTDEEIEADLVTVHQDITNLQATDARLTQQIGTKADANHDHAGVYQPAGDYANTDHTHTKAQITDFPVSMPASDVAAWAKSASKPTYTAAEIGAATSGHTHPDYVSTSDIRLTNARPANGGNASTVGGLNPATFVQKNISNVCEFIGVDGGSGWSYLRLANNNSCHWDIAETPNNNNTLEFRPDGSGTNEMSLTKTGILTVSNLLKCYSYSNRPKLPAITIDKPGDGAFGIGPDGTNMRIRYGSTDGIAGASWQNFGIQHYFDGTMICSGYATFVAGAGKSSDMRFKTVTGNITDALPAIKELDTFRYRWDKEGEEHNSIGVSAQQVREYFPELVKEADDEYKTLTVDYNGLVPVCMQAIKELTARIEKLEDQTK